MHRSLVQRSLVLKHSSGPLSDVNDVWQQLPALGAATYLDRLLATSKLGL